MKEFIIVTIIALFATAWVFDTHSPPQGVKGAVSGVAASTPAGNYKKDEVYGDFKLTDGYRDLKIRTTVYDDNDPRASARNDSDFPLSGTGN
ncbi:MAG TPA: hypothetical protein V6C97_11450 [Oculatellaceae cyanobacterium]